MVNGDQPYVAWSQDGEAYAVGIARSEGTLTPVLPLGPGEIENFAIGRAQPPTLRRVRAIFSLNSDEGHLTRIGPTGSERVISATRRVSPSVTATTVDRTSATASSTGSSRPGAATTMCSTSPVRLDGQPAGALPLDPRRRRSSRSSPSGPLSRSAQRTRHPECRADDVGAADLHSAHRVHRQHRRAGPGHCRVCPQPTTTTPAASLPRRLSRAPDGCAPQRLRGAALGERPGDERMLAGVHVDRRQCPAGDVDVLDRGSDRSQPVFDV